MGRGMGDILYSPCQEKSEKIINSFDINKINMAPNF